MCDGEDSRHRRSRLHRLAPRPRARRARRRGRGPRQPRGAGARGRRPARCPTAFDSCTATSATAARRSTRSTASTAWYTSARCRRRAVDVRDRPLRRAQHDGDGVFLERLVAREPRRRGSSSPRRCRSTARASTSALITAASRRTAARGAAPRARVGVLLSRRAVASSHRWRRREAEAADPDVGLRDHEARPRGVVPRRRCAPTASRLSRCASSTSTGRAGALEPVHRRRCDLRLAPAERSRRSSSRTAGSRATSSTSATSCAGSCSRSSRTMRSDRPSTSAPAGRARSTTSQRSSPTGSDVELEPESCRAVSRRRHPTLLRGHSRGARSCSAFGPSVELRGRHARADRLARGSGGRRPRRRRDDRARSAGSRAELRGPCTTSRSSSSRRTRPTGSDRASRPCSSTRARSSLDVIVVDNESTDGTRELVESEFPRARESSLCENHGFAHANNRALYDDRRPLRAVPEPRYGDPRGDVRGARRRPRRAAAVGLAGVRQLTADGELFPTIRRFPTPCGRLATRSPPSGGRSHRVGSASASST